MLKFRPLTMLYFLKKYWLDNKRGPRNKVGFDFDFCPFKKN